MKGFVYLIVNQVGTIHHYFSDEVGATVDAAWAAMKASRETVIDGITYFVRGGKLWNDAKVKNGVVCGPLNGVDEPDDTFGDMTPIDNTTSRYTNVPLSCSNTTDETNILRIFVSGGELPDAHTVIVRANLLLSNVDVVGPNCDVKITIDGTPVLIASYGPDPDEEISVPLEIKLHRVGTSLIASVFTLTNGALVVNDTFSAIDFAEDIDILLTATWDSADAGLVCEVTAATSFKQPET